MRVIAGIFIMSLAMGICLPATAAQNKITAKQQPRIGLGDGNINDNGVGPGNLPGDYAESQQKPKPKPQTPASGTVSPGTATQTPSVPKPTKPPKPPVVTLPKPTNPNSSSNVGSTQNGTVTLPNGTTVYKNITSKTHKDLK